MRDSPTAPDTGACGFSGALHERTWVITASGELDASCGAALDEQFAAAAGFVHDRVDVDASSVTFFDCGALRHLLRAAQRCPVEVWLRRPSRAVRRIIQLAGLTGELPGDDPDDPRFDEMRLP